VHVFDGQTLQLDKELSMSGVVITDMTPGVPPQADMKPQKDNVYPTKSPEQQARDAANEAKRQEGQNAAYTDAALDEVPLTEDQVIAAAKDAKKPYGDVQYADPGYQKDGKKRYPIDTEEHIRAAWSYINKSKNCSQYTPEQCAHIKSKIVSAWKAKIDKAGPEGAKASIPYELGNGNASWQGCLTLSLTQLGAIASKLNSLLPSVSPSNPTTSPMNLADLKQSLASVKTVEDLPTVVANVSLFADTIAAASEKLVVERTAAQDAAKAAQASVDQIKADLDKLTKTHNEMVAAQQAVAAEAKFNERMEAVAATFDLDDEVRAEIVDEIKACVDDAAFTKWMTSAKKKMKGFMKKKAADKNADNDADDTDDTDASAKAAAKTALASAAANVVDAPVSNANATFDATAAKSLVEQMASTFAANTSIGGVKVKDITKSAKK
jgi:hypothetical protein